MILALFALSVAQAAQLKPMLQRVDSIDFGRDFKPHCTLKNIHGIPVMRSGIERNGQRQAVIRINDEVIRLALGPKPSEFKNSERTLKASVSYSPSSVRHYGDGVDFKAELRVSSPTGATQTRVRVKCYARDFDEDWAKVAPVSE